MHSRRTPTHTQWVGEQDVDAVISSNERKFQHQLLVIKKNYEDRIAAVTEEVAATFQELQNDEVLQLMAKDQTSAIHIVERLKEVLYATLHSEQELYVQNLLVQISALSAEKIEQKRENQALRQSLQQDAAKLSELERTIESLNTQLKELSQRQSESQQLEEQTKVDFQTYNQQIRDQQNRIEELETQVHTLEKEARNALKERDMAKDLVDQLRLDIESLRLKNENADQEKLQYEQSMAALKEQKKQLKASLEEAKLELTKSERERMELRSMYISISEKVESLIRTEERDTGSADSVNVMKVKIKDMKSKLIEEMKQHKLYMRSQKKALKETEGKLELKARELQEASTIIQKLQNKVVKYKERLEEQARQHLKVTENMKRNLRDMEDTLAREKRSLADLQREFDAKISARNDENEKRIKESYDAKIYALQREVHEKEQLLHKASLQQLIETQIATLTSKQIAQTQPQAVPTRADISAVDSRKLDKLEKAIIIYENKITNYERDYISKLEHHQAIRQLEIKQQSELQQLAKQTEEELKSTIRELEELKQKEIRDLEEKQSKDLRILDDHRVAELRLMEEQFLKEIQELDSRRQSELKQLDELKLDIQELDTRRLSELKLAEERRLKDLKEVEERKQKEFSITLASIRQSVKKLESNLDEEKRLNKRLLEQIDDEKKIASHLKNDVQAIEYSKRALVEHLEEAAKNMNKLKDMVEAEKDKREHTYILNEQLNTEINDLKQDYHELTTEFQAIERQLLSEKGAARESKEALEKEIEGSKLLRTDIASLSEKLKTVEQDRKNIIEAIQSIIMMTSTQIELTSNQSPLAKVSVFESSRTLGMSAAELCEELSRCILLLRDESQKQIQQLQSDLLSSRKAIEQTSRLRKQQAQKLQQQIQVAKDLQIELAATQAKCSNFERRISQLQSSQAAFLELVTMASEHANASPELNLSDLTDSRSIAEYTKKLKSLLQQSQQQKLDVLLEQCREKDVQIKQLIETHEQRLNLVMSERQTITQQLQAEKSEAISCLKKEFEAHSNSTMEHHQALIGKLKAEHAVELAALKQEQAECISQLKASFETHYDDLRNKMKRDNEEQILHMSHNHDQQIQTLNRNFNEKFENQERNHELLIGTLKHDQEQLVATLKQDHEQQLETLKHDHNEQLTVLIRDHEQLVGRLKLDQEQLVGKLKCDQDQLVGALKRDHEQQLAAQKRVHEQQLETLKRDHKEQVSRLSTSRDSLKSELQAIITQLRQEKDDIATQLSEEKQISENNAERARTIQEERNNDVGRLNKEIDDLRKSKAEVKMLLQTELQTLYSQVEALQQRYNEDMLRNKELHENSNQQLKVSYEKQIDLVKQRLERENAKNEELQRDRKKLMDELEKVRTKLDIALKELERKASDIEQLTGRAQAAVESEGEMLLELRKRLDEKEQQLQKEERNKSKLLERIEKKDKEISSLQLLLERNMSQAMETIRTSSQVADNESQRLSDAVSRVRVRHSTDRSSFDTNHQTTAGSRILPAPNLSAIANDTANLSDIYST